MVQRLIEFFNKEFSGLHQAAFLLGVSSLASQLLGLLRDRLLARNFGAGTELDIYYAAFRLPDFIFVSVGSFLAVTVLIPILVEKVEQESREEVRSFMSSLFTFFLIIITLVSIAAYILAPFLTKFIAPGFSPESQVKLVMMTRILLLSPFFLGLSNLFGAVTQSYRRFFIYAISPILYNLGIISGVIFFYPIYGLNGLVYGVVLGAMFHLLAQVPVVVQEDFVPRFRLGFLKKDILRVIKLSLPRTIALGTNQLAVMVLVAMASFMLAGSISIFNFSFNLQSVPMALIGISYSVAAFPTMSKIFSSGKKEEFVSYTAEALRHIIFWSLPIAVLFIVLRAQIVRTILGSGQFNWTHTKLTAAALAIFAVSIVCQNIVQLFDRAYYATGRTRTPVLIKVFSSIAIVISAFLFIKVFGRFGPAHVILDTLLRVNDVPGSDVLILPFAYSLGSLLNASLLWITFERDIKADLSRRMARVFLEALAGSLVIGIVTLVGLNIFNGFLNLQTFFGIFLQGLFSGIMGIAAGVIFLVYIDNREIKESIALFSKKFLSSMPIIPGPEQL